MKKLLVISGDNAIYLIDAHVKSRQSIIVNVKDRGVKKFFIDQIICCHYYNKRANLMMKGGLCAEVTENISGIFDKINSKDFYRVGCFYFVNLDYLVEIIRVNRKGSIIMREKHVITVCKQYIHRLIKNMKEADEYIILRVKKY